MSASRSGGKGSEGPGPIMGVLYVVATPIGNLEDITLRALRVLREVGLIAAEDTRSTRVLLARYDIKTPLTSYHEHNKRAKIPHLVEALRSRDVALVSEAGMPVVSDPGRELVLEAVRSGIQVIPIPGASAVTASVALSAMGSEGFLFLGFLPRHKGKRRRLLESLRTQSHAIVAFEAPHRLCSSLQDILEVLGDRDISICRELTKLHEEVFRGTVTQALAHFTDPRGEFTVVIGEAPRTKVARDLSEDLGWARDELRRLKDQGLKAREAVAIVARAVEVPRRDVYKLWLDIGRE